jgi:hypothetical protein
LTRSTTGRSVFLQVKNTERWKSLGSATIALFVLFDKIYLIMD